MGQNKTLMKRADGTWSDGGAGSGLDADLVRGKEAVLNEWDFDSGWIDIKNNSHYDIVHNLGTYYFLVACFQRKDVDGLPFFKTASNIFRDSDDNIGGFELEVKDENTLSLNIGNNYSMMGDNSIQYGDLISDNSFTESQIRIFLKRIG